MPEQLVGSRNCISKGLVLVNYILGLVNRADNYRAATAEAAAVQEAAHRRPRSQGFQGWLRINTSSSLLTSCSTPTRSSIFHCAFSPCLSHPLSQPTNQPARTAVWRHRHKGLSIVMRSSCCWCHPGLLLPFICRSSEFLRENMVQWLPLLGHSLFSWAEPVFTSHRESWREPGFHQPV